MFEDISRIRRGSEGLEKLDPDPERVSLNAKRRQRSEHRQKKGELHQLPYTECLKSGAIQL